MFWRPQRPLIRQLVFEHCSFSIHPNWDRKDQIFIACNPTPFPVIAEERGAGLFIRYAGEKSGALFSYDELFPLIGSHKK